MVGDSGAGKTSLIQRYVNNVYDPLNWKATVGVEFSSKSLVKEDGKILRA